jgi:hypothetical protein
VGSTVNINTPAASAVTVAGPSGDFNLPADGLYVLGMLPSGTQANNSAISAGLALQQHWV